MSSKIILYKSDKCPACQQQMKLLEKFNKKKITIHDIDKKGIPDFLKGPKGDISIPTWVFIKPGVIDPTEILNNANNTKNTKKPRTSKFGLSEVGTLAKYGKDYLDADKFNNPGKNYLEEVKDTWGSNYLTSGTYGRELGSSADLSKLYTNAYTGNNIRMTRPGGLEDALIMTNYNCNNKGSNNNNLGLYTDSKNSFKFGGLSKQTLDNDYFIYRSPPFNGLTKPRMVASKTFSGKVLSNYFFGKKIKSKTAIKYSTKSAIKKKNIKKKNTKINTKINTKPKKNTKKKVVIKEGSVITLKRKKNGLSKIKIKN